MTTPPVSLSQLESHLWEAANILRGPVDAADFKTYVFPLLFFKRISDVHDEEYQAALTESGGDEEYARFPQNYRFQISDDCHCVLTRIDWFKVALDALSWEENADRQGTESKPGDWRKFQAEVGKHLLSNLKNKKRGEDVPPAEVELDSYDDVATEATPRNGATSASTARSGT